MYVLDNIYICNDVYVYVHSHVFFIFHCNEHRESEKFNGCKLRLHTAYSPFNPGCQGLAIVLLPI